MAAAKTSSENKYGPAAGKSVEREMKAFKEGKLKSGSGETVTNPKLLRAYIAEHRTVLKIVSAHG